jgi:FMN phosphatase YigB (HAD superfamily)
MKPRAAIFDIYGTVLEIGPPVEAAEVGWTALWRARFNSQPRLSLEEFDGAFQRLVAREHATARANGIPWPEVFWPDAVREIVPETVSCAPAVAADFIFELAILRRSVRLMPGAAAVLAWLRKAGVLLGIASNAQPYTLRELERALAEGGLALDIFAPDLCFWSFAHGFSKPDPHVFRLLTARLRAMDVAPSETLMVGDRQDNDVRPARSQAWRTWHLTAQRGGNQTEGGGWAELGNMLAADRDTR